MGVPEIDKSCKRFVDFVFLNIKHNFTHGADAFAEIPIARKVRLKTEPLDITASDLNNTNMKQFGGKIWILFLNLHKSKGNYLSFLSV